MARILNLFHLSHVRFLFDMFRSAVGGIEWYVLAYIICIALFFIIGKELYNMTFVYPFFFMLITIFNPFLIVPLSQYIGLTERIRRIFWLLPINIVLALVTVTLIFKFKESWKRFAAGAILCLLITMAGSSTLPHMQSVENVYKTTNSILQISDFLEQDSKEHNLKKRVMYSSQQLLELRQYDPSIESVFRRLDLLDFQIPDKSDASVQAVINSGHRSHIVALVNQYCIPIDRDIFMTNAKICQANYIIQETASNMSEYYASVSYPKIAEIGPFEIFRADY